MSNRPCCTELPVAKGLNNIHVSQAFELRYQEKYCVDNKVQEIWASSTSISVVTTGILLHQMKHDEQCMKSWDQQNYLVIKRVCDIRPLYNEVPL